MDHRSIKDFVQEELIDHKPEEQPPLKREDVYKVPKFADEISIDTKKEFKVEHTLSRGEFYGLPFAKMKPIDQS